MLLHCYLGTRENAVTFFKAWCGEFDSLAFPIIIVA